MAADYVVPLLMLFQIVVLHRYMETNPKYDRFAVLFGGFNRHKHLYVELACSHLRLREL